MRIYVQAVSCIVMVCGACSARGGVASLAPVLPSERVYSDDGPGFQDSLTMTVRDEFTWQDVWDRATHGQPSPPERPQIDFTSEMLVVVAAGRMNPGDLVRIDSVGARGDYFLVIFRTLEECEPFPGEAHPIEIVRVPLTSKTVTFEGRRESAPHCR